MLSSSSPPSPLPFSVRKFKANFPTISNWPADETPQYYEALSKRYFNTETNFVWLSYQVVDLLAFPRTSNRNTACLVCVDTLKGVGVFESDSGRKMLVFIANQSKIPAPHHSPPGAARRSIDWIESTIFQNNVDIIAQLARHSFTFNPDRHCITVDDHDVHSLLGSPK